MTHDILHGVDTFQRDVFPGKRKLFERLAGGQNPKALFITCSDSRIDPSLVTQTEPGELFIIRNAGNIVPPYPMGGGEAASVEFAVTVLGVGQIIVCGHSHCGAVQAMLNPELVEDKPLLADWIGHVRRAHTTVDHRLRREPTGDPVRAAIERNVVLQLLNLETFPTVASRVAAGELSLEGWVYTFESGEIHVYDPAEDRFLPLGERAEPAGAEPVQS